MQDRPAASELLDAMAAQLFGEVREWVPRERRFQILVLANLCAVIARELRAGNGPDLRDKVLFESLLSKCRTNAGHSENPESEAGGTPAARDLAAELARRLRNGDLDADLDGTIEGLREYVKRKLEIARPGYAER
jgi:hypothetical protein